MSNIKTLEELADSNEQCYCPDGTNEFWRCRYCFATGVLNELASIADDGVRELSKENSELVKQGATMQPIDNNLKEIL